MTETTVHGKLFIGGNWRDAADGRTIDNINPANGQVTNKLAAGHTVDVDEAVKSARKAFEDKSWAGMAASDRGKLLYKLAGLIEKHTEELARLETMDNGKPIFESTYADLPATIGVYEYYAGWANKIHGETIPVRGPFLNYTLREPVGVVGAIIPWNFPLMLTAWKVAPALAAGCTMVVKPAEQTSLSTLRLADLITEAGFPPGVFNVVTGLGEEAGMAMVKHPGIDKIAFTGSTETGKLIMRAGADTIKRITLELGGKSPNIILEDADLDAAIMGAYMGIFYGKGEICCAGSRLFVHKNIQEKVLEKLVASAKALVPADPMDPKTRMGAICSEEQMNKVLSYIDIGSKEGAEVLAGGSRVHIGSGGFYVQPTIFGGVNNSMRLAQEEIFGPVLATIPFTDVDDAVREANNTPFGLAAAVWTRNISKAHTIAARLKAGTVWINTYNQFDPAAPFGGFKQSGFGKECGKHALDNFTQTKDVWVNLGV